MYSAVKWSIFVFATLAMAYMASAKFQTDFEVERFEFGKVTDRSMWNFERLKYKKLNRTMKVFSGEIEFLGELNDDYSVMVEIWKMEGNEYRKTAFKIGPYPSCEFIKKEEMFYPELVKVSDFPKPGTCPLPKGVRTVDNYIMDASKIPQNFEGKYRGRIMVLLKNELIDEASVFTTIRHDIVY